MNSYREMNSHPEETDLALLAGGDCTRISRFFLQRHLRECRECTEKLARYELLREETAHLPAPDVDWTFLAAEMKANIRLGLEAGECVRAVSPVRAWNPRVAVAFASLTFLVGAGLLMRAPAHVNQAPVASAASASALDAPTLESSGTGLELRDGASSITLISHPGSVSDRTVSAQGEIRARNVEGGAVTFTNVSLD